MFLVHCDVLHRNICTCCTPHSLRKPVTMYLHRPIVIRQTDITELLLRVMDFFVAASTAAMFLSLVHQEIDTIEHLVCWNFFYMCFDMCGKIRIFLLLFLLLFYFFFFFFSLCCCSLVLCSLVCALVRLRLSVRKFSIELIIYVWNEIISVWLWIVTMRITVATYTLDSFDQFT